MAAPTLLDIVRARQALAAYLRPTPLYRSPGFSDRLGCEVYVKYENFQPIRSFKVRGALYTLSRLAGDARARGVITASTGNHGQGIAYAAAALGVPATVIVPHGTPTVKSEAIRRLGAALLVHGNDITDGFQRAKEIAAERGMVYIEDGEDPGLMAGAATIGLEIVDDLPDVETVVVPVGGGNLIAGLSLALKSLGPDIRIVGVQAENAPAVYLSCRQGARVFTESCETFAGGLATRYPGALAFEVLKDRVDEMHLVTEEDMRRAIPVVLEHTGHIAEGAAAAAFALCMKQAAAWAGKRVVVLFSGGNLDMATLKDVLHRAG